VLPGQLVIRPATVLEVGAVARLINLAFEVERFFVTGDRIREADVNARMTSGAFLVADLGDGGIIGCVYAEQRVDGRGYIGLLAVDPAHQGSGLGRLLMRDAEQHCRQAGCTEVFITVVNLRTELAPLYRSLGYREQGTAPFTDERAITDCHFIIMAKPLG
jgi:predicted N-acetyltransferase YhbS